MEHSAVPKKLVLYSRVHGCRHTYFMEQLVNSKVFIEMASKVV